MEFSIEEYKKWAEEVQCELKKKDTIIDWKKQYSDYAEGILKNKEKVKDSKKTFHVPKQLGCYLTLGNVIKGKTTYDLRYRGQSVGNIYVDKKGQVYLYVDKEKCENNEKYFGYGKYFNEYANDQSGIIDELWSEGKKAKLFRKFFTDAVDGEKMPHSIEHMVETRLFTEFARKQGKGKQIIGIQPIKFANSYTHMKTGVKASESKKRKVFLSKQGGEIDIFCRRKVSVTESRLTVIEVKDKEERGESFKEAMNQAVSYAVFIRELIRTSCGSNWMKIWGINGDISEGITINAVVAIPSDSADVPKFPTQPIELGEDKIELHYMVLKKSILEPEGEVYIETDL